MEKLLKIRYTVFFPVIENNVVNQYDTSSGSDS